MKRRGFLRAGAAMALGCLVSRCAGTNGGGERAAARRSPARGAPGRRAPVRSSAPSRPGPKKDVALADVFEHYDDSATGARVYTLTRGRHQDQTVYQTHPQWTPGMEHLVFTSDRSGRGQQPHAVEMTTGKIRPLLEHPAEDFAMSWRSGNLYYVHERAMYVVNVVEAFNGEGTTRRVALLPNEVASVVGGLSVDASEQVVYLGAVMEPDTRWGIVAIAPADGASRLIAPLDFQVGHVQANPFVEGEIMFCHETGGDAPQRMWFVDVKERTPRPFYQETFDEWVTHEVWWGRDRAIFTVWPYDEARAAMPHGVAWTDKASGELNVINRCRAWHTHGSPNGRWAMCDDFDRNIWLIRVDTGERRLWTQGHNGDGMSTHPHASFTPDSGGLVLTSSRGGTDSILLAELPEWESLPPLET